MINRKIERLGPTEPDINAFHFVCPNDREVEVRAVLNGMDGVQLYEESKPINYQVFGTNRRLEGNLVAGICYPWMTPEVRSELWSRRVADMDEVTEVRVLQRQELWEVHGTLTGYRKWLKRR